MDLGIMVTEISKCFVTKIMYIVCLVAILLSDRVVHLSRSFMKRLRSWSGLIHETRLVFGSQRVINQACGAQTLCWINLNCLLI